MSDKLIDNKRFTTLTDLANVVNSRNTRKAYTTSLDRAIANFIIADTIRPKSLFEQGYHL